MRWSLNKIDIVRTNKDNQHTKRKNIPYQYDLISQGMEIERASMKNPLNSKPLNKTYEILAKI